MSINLKKLIRIVEDKTNGAIEKLNDIKYASDDYNTLLLSIVDNINILSDIEKHNTKCEDCSKSTVTNPTDEKVDFLNNRTSLKGLKYEPFNKKE
jgi:cell division protein ZapA (FtsZ GTPase activity inhibitor)